ncbi:hypothetical protein DICPUDRAFT_96169 [Dictyostelium purpureum]|uniref:Nucleotide exchange factor Fes1 domain-containing protein n=1 Tax=Dictyostelium purpureum TaxID=5786 RepID=F1A5S4_DICPU|nr:uncharacterized protein DICPUDRAFT_96169 [Dictyostelium purpureum]EGC28454.1 hypothetical protein DICPUDRAFT_96169 [Dictyostelium purpureum]|eukprot:XP_003295017.1 hypothetical protein DICPUDRAFT_96169 [Dictyostelium purpureum]
MEGVVKTSILTAISAITKNKNNSKNNNKSNNNNTIKPNRNTTTTTTTTTTTPTSKRSNIYSGSSSSSSSSSSSGLGIPYGTSSSEEIATLDDSDPDHEISTSSSSETDFLQNSPRTVQDHLRILRSDDLSNQMVIKKLDSVHVLSSVVSYSESLALLSNLNSISVVVNSLNSLLALEMISKNQNTLMIKLGLLLGNLLQYPENQKKIIETRFISTLVNLINDDDAERADFSLFSLFNLSQNEECGTEIILSQGIKEVITLLESKKATNSLKKQALQIILNMYLESENLRSMISSENEQLIGVLKYIIANNSKSDFSELASKILNMNYEHQKYINDNYSQNYSDEEEEDEDEDE